VKCSRLSLLVIDLSLGALYVLTPVFLEGFNQISMLSVQHIFWALTFPHYQWTSWYFPGWIRL